MWQEPNDGIVKITRKDTDCEPSLGHLAYDWSVSRIDSIAPESSGPRLTIGGRDAYISARAPSPDGRRAAKRVPQSRKSFELISSAVLVVW